MSPLKISSIVAVLAVAVTAGGLYVRHGSRQREVQSLRWENDQLRREAAARFARDANATNAAATSRADPVAGPETNAMAPRPAEYYRNEGNATPRAALQTFAWACDRGDVDAVSRLIVLEPAALRKAEIFWASLPERSRAPWKSVDEMAAAVLARSVMERPFPAHDLLATASAEEISPDRVRLHMPNVPAPRGITDYQRSADGWRYVVTEQVVDAFIQQSRRR